MAWAVAVHLVDLLHGAATTPVPHWAVLLVAVPALWLLVWTGVAVLGRLLDRVA